LKLIFEVATEYLDVVETLRKPSTGLKQLDEDFMIDLLRVETLRKPSTGLKLVTAAKCNRPLRSRHSENPARD